MVYVSRDGTVYQERPWGIGKVIAIFWGIINLIVAFFQTLIPGFMDTTSSNSGFRSGGNRDTKRSGGGFGGGSNGGRRPPRPPGPGGNIRGLGSLPPSPPPACGSCCGL